MKIIGILLSVIAAAMARGEVRTERVEYKHGETVLRGWLAYDDAVNEARPGVMVVHEWWGCNEYAKNRATQLAGLGYVAFACDMFGEGQTTTDAKQAGEWAGKVSGDQNLMRERAAAGLAVLAEHARVDAEKLAVIGYCFGGMVALETARSGLGFSKNVRAVVSFHAGTIAAKTPADNKNIKGSVLICHGAVDDFVKPEQIEQFTKQMEEAKVDYQFVSYGGAVHSFTNPGADGSFSPMVKYDSKADKRSWEVMRDLFREKLGW